MQNDSLKCKIIKYCFNFDFYILNFVCLFYGFNIFLN